MQRNDMHVYLEKHKPIELFIIKLWIQLFGISKKSWKC